MLELRKKCLFSPDKIHQEILTIVQKPKGKNANFKRELQVQRRVKSLGKTVRRVKILNWLTLHLRTIGKSKNLKKKVK